MYFNLKSFLYLREIIKRRRIQRMMIGYESKFNQQYNRIPLIKKLWIVRKSGLDSSFASNFVFFSHKHKRSLYVLGILQFHVFCVLTKSNREQMNCVQALKQKLQSQVPLISIPRGGG